MISFNTRDMTVECIRSLFAQTAVELIEVAALDNCSVDGSADAIATAFPQVELIRSGENLGFAGGNNVAAKDARSEFLLLLNPDTVVKDHAIERLIEFARVHPESGIWGGRTMFADGRLNPASCWRRQSLWSVLCFATGLSSVFRDSALFNSEAYGGWRRDSVREVDIVSGCFLLIKRDLWEKLGGFDPEFFMYGEEADLCLRARKLGARPIVTPDATIVHYGGASERVRADKMVRLLKAKTLLIRRHWPRWQVPLGVWLLSMWPLSRKVAWSVLSLLKRPNAAEAAESWSTIWRRRSEWRGA